MPELAEVDAVRGHAFMPEPDVLDAVPAPYTTEGVPLMNKTLHLHYFVAGCDWYVAEIDPRTRLAFGYVNLGDPLNAEWGYFSLYELAEAIVHHPSGALLVVERDLDWTAQPFWFLQR